MQRRVSLPEDVVSFTSLPISQKEKMVDVAFKQISQGAVAVVIGDLNPAQSQGLSSPKILTALDVPGKINLIKFLLSRLRDLGRFSIQRFGKNYSHDREPIFAVICVNELDVDQVEEELLKNDYFGYKGILCFGCVSFQDLNIGSYWNQFAKIKIA